MENIKQPDIIKSMSLRNISCKFFSRKLVVFLLGFISGVSLIFVGKLDSTASNFICTMTGIYLAGNVINGIKEVVRKPSE